MGWTKVIGKSGRRALRKRFCKYNNTKPDPRHGLTEEEMVSGGKQRCPSEARGMSAYLVREARNLSLTDLSRRLKRDVSSLSLAADKILRCSKEDAEIRKRIKSVEKALL